MRTGAPAPTPPPSQAPPARPATPATTADPRKAAAPSSPPGSRAPATTADPRKEQPRSLSARPRRPLSPTRSRARLACATTADPRRGPAGPCPPTRPRTPCPNPATTVAPRKAAEGSGHLALIQTDGDERAPRSGGSFALQPPGRTRLYPLPTADDYASARWASVWANAAKRLLPTSGESLPGPSLAFWIHSPR